MGLFESLDRAQQETLSERARRALGDLIQREQYVGEVFSLGYEHALVLIHDRHRQQVGGIPSLSFLFATRIPEEGNLDPSREDTSILLLRVIDASPLPAHSDMERIRVEMAQRASGSREHWDNPKVMDSYTANELSFAGVKCRIVGTFYLEDAGNDRLELRFGSDISNYYPNQGLKVFKPREASLAAVVNFRDEGRLANHPLAHLTVEVGSVRYASTNRSGQGVGVRVNIAPADLVDQKTALFGMTRVGKSNTAKIIAKSIFDMRLIDPRAGRIGQLIFDYNGEYANENTQDAGGQQNASALKNVWRRRGGDRSDVVTYGSIPRPDVDPDRRLTKLNFFADANLQTGKDLIDLALAEYGDKYIKNFQETPLSPPADPQDRGLQTRYNRQVFVYRSLLARAGFSPPPTMAQARCRGLFGEDIRNALASSANDPSGDHGQAAQLLARETISWDQAATAMAALGDFIRRGTQTGYQTFNTQYQSRPGGSGESWADQTPSTSRGCGPIPPA